MKLYTTLTRRKKDDGPGYTNESQLARVLSTFDLVALGVGSTLGVGVYVVAGGVAKESAGPAVVLSFLIAAFVTALAGMSYAEFGARVPRAGSAYIYSYYCVGEFAAFIIGWSLILEYSIGAASVAKGISSYVDSLTNYAIKDFFTNIAPLQGDFFSDYVDFFALGLCLLLTIILAFGVKESSIINTAFTTINVGVVLFFIISGLFFADFHNWNIAKSEIPAGIDGGNGGFMPFGLSGVIRGAAICFYGFVGFDCIATTGEEVRNPQRAIPWAIIISLTIVLSAYLGVSAVITLIVPYYLEDVDAPILHAYDMVGWTPGKWVVGIGALFGFFASLFGALFPLPRIIYAMANDGLLFRWLGKVHPKYKTPLVGTIVSGLITSILAAMFNLQQLVGLNAIGTLLTYSLVSICVVILRFQESDDDLTISEETYLLPKIGSDVSLKAVMGQFCSFHNTLNPTAVSSRLVVLLVIIFCVLSVCFSYAMEVLKEAVFDGSVGSIAVVSVLGLMLLVTVISIAMQPASSQPLSFKMPLVPFLPCISILVNIYLMVVLDLHTWIRFLATIFMGLIIYFTYGIRNSSENSKAHYKDVTDNFEPAKQCIVY